MLSADRIVDEFIQLVTIDSESGAERQIADVLKSKLKDLGLVVYEDNAGEILQTDTGNIIANLPGTLTGLPTVFFSAHMDTVKPGKGVEPIVTNDIITTKGDTVLGGDDKAGIVAILETIRILKEENIPHGDIQVIFSVWEEGGLKGAKNLEFNKLKAQFGYVLDCDGPAGTIITQAPAQNSIKATIFGKKAHAGICPEEGINAILVASEAISNMQLGRIDEQTTANIGIINGGEATNIVPDKVVVEGEARSINIEKLKLQTDLISNAFIKMAQKHGTKVEVTVENVYPNINLKETDQVVQIALQAASNIDITPQLKHTGGGSDANIYNGHGIPTANLGIGMSKVHTSDEYLQIKDLMQTTQYLIEIIKIIK